MAPFRITPSDDERDARPATTIVVPPLAARTAIASAPARTRTNVAHNGDGEPEQDTAAHADDEGDGGVGRHPGGEGSEDGSSEGHGESSYAQYVRDHAQARRTSEDPSSPTSPTTSRGAPTANPDFILDRLEFFLGMTQKTFSTRQYAHYAELVSQLVMKTHPFYQRRRLLRILAAYGPVLRGFETWYEQYPQAFRDLNDLAQHLDAATMELSEDDRVDRRGWPSWQSSQDSDEEEAPHERDFSRWEREVEGRRHGGPFRSYDSDESSSRSWASFSDGIGVLKGRPPIDWQPPRGTDPARWRAYWATPPSSSADEREFAYHEQVERDKGGRVKVPATVASPPRASATISRLSRTGGTVKIPSGAALASGYGGLARGGALGFSLPDVPGVEHVRIRDTCAQCYGISRCIFIASLSRVPRCLRCQRAAQQCNFPYRAAPLPTHDRMRPELPGAYRVANQPGERDLARANALPVVDSFYDLPRPAGLQEVRPAHYERWVRDGRPYTALYAPGDDAEEAVDPPVLASAARPDEPERRPALVRESASEPIAIEGGDPSRVTTSRASRRLQPRLNLLRLPNHPRTARDGTTAPSRVAGRSFTVRDVTPMAVDPTTAPPTREATPMDVDPLPSMVDSPPPVLGASRPRSSTAGSAQLRPAKRSRTDLQVAGSSGGDWRGVDDRHVVPPFPVRRDPTGGPEEDSEPPISAALIDLVPRGLHEANFDNTLRWFAWWTNDIRWLTGSGFGPASEDIRDRATTFARMLHGDYPIVRRFVNAVGTWLKTRAPVMSKPGPP